MLAALIPAVTELATGYLSNRKEKAVAKQKLAVAKIEAQVTKVQSDATWEEKAIDSSTQSLKDEAWTICFIVIIAAAMGLTFSHTSRKASVSSRTTAPSGCPGASLASIAASFGLKSIGQFKK